jgi:hypothetical protein
MKRSLIALISGGMLALSSAALAAEGDFDAVDANSDGELTIQEVMAVDSGWTEAKVVHVDDAAEA